MNFAFPYRIDARGRTADADEASQVRGLIEQTLLTIPGERFNRSSFGGGIQRLVFHAATPEMEAAAELLLRTTLEQVLGSRARVQRVSLRQEEETLTITLQYVLLANGTTQVTELQLGGAR